MYVFIIGQKRFNISKNGEKKICMVWCKYMYKKYD